MQTFIEKYYIKELHLENIKSIILLGVSIGLFFGVLIMTCLYVVRLNDSRIIINCGSFSSYKDALRAYNMGDRALDHNHNGVPCESLI